MTDFYPLRDKLKNTLFQRDDLLVLFGEVFDRGYVNGLIEEAEKIGMTLIYSTVGRRDKEGLLSPLSPEELAQKNQKPFINVPLEAGFDLEKSKSGISPVEQLQEYGLKGWEDARLDWAAIEESHQSGVERFRKQTAHFMNEVRELWEPGKNILFAHTMAGGFPRAKVIMPIANRTFKGSGARFQSSKIFWDSEIGKLCAKSFVEVTANTLQHLIDGSKTLRADVEKSGGQVRYLGYGYHGNETMIGDKFEWFSYSPYLQGWAKIELENIAKRANQDGVGTCIFNVPEILTNSSSIFLGIEIALYSLMRAFRHAAPDHPAVLKLIERCQSKLKDGATVDDVDRLTQEYLKHPAVRSLPKFATWPQHNTPESMEVMRSYSDQILALHKNDKDLLTAELSEVIFRTTGHIMLNEMSVPRRAVAWIGHDLVAKSYLRDF